MSSSNDGPTRPSEKTYNLLYAKSSNRCAFPGCKNPITVNQTLVGNVCHIKAAKPGGPRYDPSQSNEERHGYDNVLLMCSIHNKVVDDDVTTYTVDRLKQMKVDHEAESSPIQEETIKLAVGLLMTGTDSVGVGEITVSATNPQNSVIAGSIKALFITIPQSLRPALRWPRYKHRILSLSSELHGRQQFQDVDDDAETLWPRPRPQLQDRFLRQGSN